MLNLNAIRTASMQSIPYRYRIFRKPAAIKTESGISS